MEVFLKLIKKAPQLFEKANYVRQRTIISLFVSNVTIESKNKVFITLKPGLLKCFGGNLKMTATIVNSYYDYITKTKLKYARKLIKGYITVTGDHDGIEKRLSHKQKIIYDFDRFEELSGFMRY